MMNGSGGHFAKRTVTLRSQDAKKARATSHAQLNFPIVELSG